MLHRTSAASYVCNACCAAAAGQQSIQQPKRRLHQSNAGRPIHSPAAAAAAVPGNPRRGPWAAQITTPPPLRSTMPLLGGVARPPAAHPVARQPRGVPAVLRPVFDHAYEQSRHIGRTGGACKVPCYRPAVGLARRGLAVATELRNMAMRGMETPGEQPPADQATSGGHRRLSAAAANVCRLAAPLPCCRSLLSCPLPWRAACVAAYRLSCIFGVAHYALR